MLDTLTPLLSERHLRAGEVLYSGQASDTLEYVYFPTTAVTSMSAVLDDGENVEGSPVGYEGIAGFQVIFGSSRMAEEWTCSVAGTVFQMGVKDFWQHLNESPQLGRVMLCYGQSLVTMLAQSVACNAKHPLAERCAKWLLFTQDRVKSDSFRMTHEMLAIMLGVRRAGVSVVAESLRSTGVIEYMRGRITIVDRAGLEAAACECYASVTAEYDRIMALSTHQPADIVALPAGPESEEPAA